MIADILYICHLKIQLWTAWQVEYVNMYVYPTTAVFPLYPKFFDSPVLLCCQKQFNLVFMSLLCSVLLNVLCNARHKQTLLRSENVWFMHNSSGFFLHGSKSPYKQSDIDKKKETKNWGKLLGKERIVWI